MSYSLPASPSPGDEEDVLGLTFVWDGSAWHPLPPDTGGGGGGGSSIPTYVSLGNAGSTETIDVNAYDIQDLTLNSSTCAISFSGTASSGTGRWTMLRLVHDATTSTRAVTWTGIEWPNDTAPFLPDIDANAIASISILTLPSGARFGWHTGNFFP